VREREREREGEGEGERERLIKYKINTFLKQAIAN